MQIEEIDRHHPSTFVAGNEPSSINDQSLPQTGSGSEGKTGLGLDISSLDLSGSEERSVSPVAEVPGPRGPGSDRRFSAGNRAFEEQALAVCHFFCSGFDITADKQALRRVSGDTEAACPDVRGMRGPNTLTHSGSLLSSRSLERNESSMSVRERRY